MGDGSDGFVLKVWEDWLRGEKVIIIQGGVGLMEGGQGIMGEWGMVGGSWLFVMVMVVREGSDSDADND